MQTNVDEVRALVERGATILNVGAHAGKAEIRGALRYLPDDLLRPERLALPIAPDRPVVLYDEDGRGEATGHIAEKLRGQGFADVRVLEGGFRSWERDGGPTQEPSLEQVVPPSRPSDAQPLDRRL